MRFFKIFFLLIALILVVGGCSSNTSSTKMKTEKHTKKINQEFLKDIITFRDNIKNAMDDTVLNNVEKDLGSLDSKQYDEQINFLFAKYSINDLKENEVKLYSICNQTAIDYLQYGKQKILGDVDKADYALDNFRQDIDNLNKMINQY